MTIYITQDTPDNEVVNLINSGQNEFKATSIVKLDSTENFVFEVDKSYIVKFPTEKRKDKGLVAENKILDFLQDRVSLPIPKSVLSTGDKVFCWYKKASGVAVTPDIYNSIPEKFQDSICAGVAEFMLQMHAIDVAGVINSGIEFSLSTEIKPKKMLYWLAKSADSDLMGIAEKYLSRYEQINPQRKVFSHFDLHGDNIIVDPKTWQISSIIDFSNCNIFDFNKDFQPPILTNHGYYKKILKHYNAVSRVQVDERLVSIYAVCYFLKLLTYNYYVNDQENIQWWTKKLKKWMYSDGFKRFD